MLSITVAMIILYFTVRSKKKLYALHLFQGRTVPRIIRVGPRILAALPPRYLDHLKRLQTISRHPFFPKLFIKVIIDLSLRHRPKGKWHASIFPQALFQKLLLYGVASRVPLFPLVCEVESELRINTVLEKIFLYGG